MTITEMMAGAVPGTIKVRHVDWKDDQFFIPYFMRGNNVWYGDDASVFKIGAIYPCVTDSDNWELYIEPVSKPKTTRFEWIVYNQDCDRWSLYAWLATEEEMERWSRDNKYGAVRKTGRQFEV